MFSKIQNVLKDVLVKSSTSVACKNFGGNVMYSELNYLAFLHCMLDKYLG